MLVVIKGAGDLASGIAVRLAHCGISIVMTELQNPMSIRRTVCFSECIREKTYQVEDIQSVLASGFDQIRDILIQHKIAVVIDPEAKVIPFIKPDAVVDAILAKHNTGTRIDDAGIVIGIGPGFSAGTDCHAVIETQRGHNLGRVIINGPAAPDSGIPGNISGFTTERVLRAPQDGIFTEIHHIGDTVKAGEIVAKVDDSPVCAQISGVIRGLLPTGTPVTKGLKSGDIDPRCEVSNCYTVSDKARAIGGGVLEALLIFSKELPC